MGLKENLAALSNIAHSMSNYDEYIPGYRGEPREFSNGVSKMSQAEIREARYKRSPAYFKELRRANKKKKK